MLAPCVSPRHLLRYHRFDPGNGLQVPSIDRHRYARRRRAGRSRGQCRAMPAGQAVPGGLSHGRPGTPPRPTLSVRHPGSARPLPARARRAQLAAPHHSGRSHQLRYQEERCAEQHGEPAPRSQPVRSRECRYSPPPGRAIDPARESSVRQAAWSSGVPQARRDRHRQQNEQEAAQSQTDPNETGETE